MTIIPTIQTLRYLTRETTGTAPIAKRVRAKLEAFDINASSTVWQESKDVESALIEAAAVLYTYDMSGPGRERESWRFANGVESLPVNGRDYVYYINVGDSYVTTLLYDRRTDRFYVTSWGDYVESRERARDDRFPRS